MRKAVWWTLYVVGLAGMPVIASAGEEAGEKAWFERMCVAVEASCLLQGSSGVEAAEERGKNPSDATTRISMECTMEAGEHGTLRALLEAGSGAGLDSDVPSWSGWNGDSGFSGELSLSELWYERRWAGDALSLRGGKVDLTALFDANEVANSETEQFLSPGFVHNATVEFPDDNGLGAVLWASPAPAWSIGVGVADALADWENAFNRKFAIAETDLNPAFSGLAGHYRFYGWWNGKDHASWSNPEKTAENHYGFGLSCDQAVGDACVLFARWGRARSGYTEVQSVWSAGLRLDGKAWGRGKDALGVAFGRAQADEDWKETVLAEGGKAGDESHAEAYYSIDLGGGLTVTPDAQYISHAGGDEAARDAWAFALRFRTAI